MRASRKIEASEISIFAEDHRKTAAQSLQKRKLSLTSSERALDPDATDNEDDQCQVSSKTKKPRGSVGGDPGLIEAIPKLMSHLEALGKNSSLAATESMALTKEMIATESAHHLAQGDHWREERALAQNQLEARSKEWAMMHSLREREVAVAEAGTQRLDHIEAEIPNLGEAGERLGKDWGTEPLGNEKKHMLYVQPSTDHSLYSCLVVQSTTDKHRPPHTTIIPLPQGPLTAVDHKETKDQATDALGSALL